MCRHGFRLAAALAAVIVTGWTTPAAAGADEGSYWFSGPYAHDNLAVYLIHRDDADDGPVPLTLDEAMQRGLIEVIETGVVEELVVRNTGDSEVFLQSGDIFKGGKQDRVLITSMIVPPGSGDLSIDVFCVESGRWSARYGEEAGWFSQSTARLPSRDGRIALFKEAQRWFAPEGDGVAWTDGEDLQSRVWESVNVMQEDLGSAMVLDVADERSPSSLQLTLENPDLVSALERYEIALGSLVQGHRDAVGYVFAINGRIAGGDEFANGGLFRKLWTRQLTAAATEAIAEKDVSARGQPTLVEIGAFVDSARTGEPAGMSMPGELSLETRETNAVLHAELLRPDGLLVHRSLIAFW